MADFKTYKKMLDDLAAGSGPYVWDELEELMTDSFEDGKLSEEEFDVLMRQLMDIEPV